MIKINTIILLNDSHTHRFMNLMNQYTDISMYDYSEKDMKDIITKQGKWKA